MPRVLQFSWRFSAYFRDAAALNILPCAVSAKNARMACDPQKPIVVHDLSMIAASPDACHASKKKTKFKTKTMSKKQIHQEKYAFSASGAGPSKKAPTWPPGALPRSLPGPPGDLLAGPRRPKEAPRAAQEPPRPKEPPRSASRAVRPAIWRRTAAQELPGGLPKAKTRLRSAQ